MRKAASKFTLKKVDTRSALASKKSLSIGNTYRNYSTLAGEITPNMSLKSALKQVPSIVMRSSAERGQDLHESQDRGKSLDASYASILETRKEYEKNK